WPQALSRHALPAQGRELGAPALNSYSRSQSPRTGARPHPAPGYGEGAQAGSTRPRPHEPRRVARLKLHDNPATAGIQPDALGTELEPRAIRQALRGPGEPGDGGVARWTLRKISR